MITWMIIQLCNGSEPRGFCWPTQVQVVVRTKPHQHGLTFLSWHTKLYESTPDFLFFWRNGSHGAVQGLGLMALMAHEICLTAAGWTNDPSGAEISWLMPNLGGPCGHGCHLPTQGITVSHVSCLTTLEPVFLMCVCPTGFVITYQTTMIILMGKWWAPGFWDTQLSIQTQRSSCEKMWNHSIHGSRLVYRSHGATTEPWCNTDWFIAWFVDSLVGYVWLRRFQTFHIFPSLFRVDDSTERFFLGGPLSRSSGCWTPGWNRGEKRWRPVNDWIFGHVVGVTLNPLSWCTWDVAVQNGYFRGSWCVKCTSTCWHADILSYIHM